MAQNQTGSHTGGAGGSSKTSRTDVGHSLDRLARGAIESFIGSFRAASDQERQATDFRHRLTFHEDDDEKELVFKGTFSLRVKGVKGRKKDAKKRKRSPSKDSGSDRAKHSKKSDMKVKREPEVQEEATSASTQTDGSSTNLLFSNSATSNELKPSIITTSSDPLMSFPWTRNSRPRIWSPYATPSNYVSPYPMIPRTAIRSGVAKTDLGTIPRPTADDGASKIPVVGDARVKKVDDGEDDSHQNKESGEQNDPVILGSDTEPKPPTKEVLKARTKTLKHLRRSKKQYQKAATTGGDVAASHMLAMIPQAIEAYSGHTSQYHTAFVSMEASRDMSHIALDVSWDQIEVLAAKGGWISDAIIDLLLILTPPPAAGTDFLSPGNPLFLENISHAGSLKKIESALKTTTSERRHDPDLREDCRTMVSFWNPTNTHWVFFVTCVDEEGKRAITLYDSCGFASSTWRYVAMLPKFMELIGRFHAAFKDEWPGEVKKGRITRQVNDDCGPLAIDGARCVLAGNPPGVYVKAAEYGAFLRTKYLGEIRAVKEQKPSDEYDGLAVFEDDDDPAGTDSDSDDTSSDGSSENDADGDDGNPKIPLRFKPQFGSFVHSPTTQEDSADDDWDSVDEAQSFDDETDIDDTIRATE